MKERQRFLSLSYLLSRIQSKSMYIPILLLIVLIAALFNRELGIVLGLLILIGFFVFKVVFPLLLLAIAFLASINGVSEAFTHILGIFVFGVIVAICVAIFEAVKKGSKTN